MERTHQLMQQGATVRRERWFYPKYGKRCFDFIAAAAGLVILGLPIAFIGLAILILDGTPVMFRQQRIGRYGKPFTVYKFRTMTNRPEPGSSVTVAGDRRVTSFGARLRRFKLDELPQLFNVLKGEMSFVGPRPDVPGYMDKLQGEAARLLVLRPGITGPATLAFRNEETLLSQAPDPQAYNDQVIFPEKVRLNLQYLNSMSLALDMRCIIQTLRPSGTAQTRV